MQVKGTIDIDRTLGYHRVRLQPLLQPGERELVSYLALADTVVATAQCFPTQKVDYTLGSVLQTDANVEDIGILFQNRNDAEQFVRDLHDGITHINSVLTQKANDARANMLIDELLYVIPSPPDTTVRAVKEANAVEAAKEERFACIVLAIFILFLLVCLIGFLQSC